MKNNDLDERELKARFGALEAAEAGSAPAFEALSTPRSSRQRRSPRLIGLSFGLAATVGAVVLLMIPAQPTRPEPLAQLGSLVWSGPSDYLLEPVEGRSQGGIPELELGLSFPVWETPIQNPDDVER